MKYLYKSVLIFITFLTFSLLSCSNPVMGGANAALITNMYRVRVTSENNSIYFNTNSNERTITPEAVNFNSNLDYYIWGQNLINSSDKINLQKVEIKAPDANKPNEGIFEFPFDRQFYRLFLVAVQHGEAFASGKELLKSSISVDLRNCDEIKFVLSNRTVIGNGNVKLSFYADNWTVPENYEATAGIYNPIDETPISETTIAIFPTYNSKPTPPVYQLTKDSIPSGTYKLKFVLSKTIDGKKRSFTYSDNIVINPNQTTTACIAIPNIIVNPPEAPTYLIAGYEDNKNNDSDFYKVEFCWDDKSYNEEDFNLELMDISTLSAANYNAYAKPLIESFSSGSPTLPLSTMDSTWNKLITQLNSDYVTTYSRSYFENSNITTDGSFTSNSVYAIIKLLYGKRYLARIKAVNSAGGSDYAYLDLYNTGNKTLHSTDEASFTPIFWNTDSSSINRYKIEYYFRNGIFYNDTNNSIVSDNISASIYTNQKISTNQQLLNPVNYSYAQSQTATLKYLYNSNYYPWQNWKMNCGDGNTYLYADYNGYENLYLFAYYGNEPVISDLELIIKNDSNTYEDTDIVLYGHKTSATSLIPFQQGTDLSNSVVNNEIEISKSEYKYISILVNKTTNHYSSTTFQIAPQGGQGTSIEPLQTTNLYGISYNYGQFDITIKDSNGNDIYQSDKTYTIYMTSILDGSTINYILNIKFKD